MGNGSSYSIEKRYIRKNGDLIWVNLTVTLLRDESAQPKYFVVAVEDITARKNAEEALKECNERFQIGFDSANIAICLVDMDGCFIKVNEQMSAMYGYSKEALETMAVKDIIYPEDLGVSAPFNQRVLSGEISHEKVSKRYLHKDGHTVWGEVSSSVVKDTRGDPLYGMYYIIDITERNQAEIRLQKCEELYKSTLNDLLAGVVVHSGDSSILLNNPEAKNILGLTQEQLYGKKAIDPAWNFVHEDSTIMNIEDYPISKVISTKKALYNYVLGINKPDKNSITWVIVNAIPVLTDDNSVDKVVINFVDISNRKQVEENRDQLMHDVTERLKESRCIYTIVNSIRTSESLDELFHDTMVAIPLGWQYPDITRCKLRYNDDEWVSEPFEETVWKQSSGIIVDNKICGSIEVYYIEKMPLQDEGPFISHERHLLDSIAHTLSEAIERKLATELLKDSETRLRMIYDYAPIMIYAFDAKGRCVMWNKECERVFGWTAEEVFSYETPLGLFYPDPVIQKQIVQSMLKPDNTLREWYPVSKNGLRIACLWACFKLPDGNVISLGQDITKRKQAEQKLNEYQQRLKSLAVQLTLAEEQERRRIAADLHDNVGQTLALTRLQLVTARKDVVKDSKQDVLFDDISKSLLEAIQDTRHLIFELSSPSLNEFGLGAAIREWMDENVAKKHGLKVNFFDHAQGVLLGKDLRAILFRNVRELLTNAIKHAQANSVSVWLENKAGQLSISIEDDGVGFDPEQTLQGVNATGGFGLFSVQERMNDLGGKMEILSQPGKGCRIVMRLSVKDQSSGEDA